jgi:hypothetical protein
MLLLSFLLVSIGQNFGISTAVEQGVSGINKNNKANTGFLIFSPDSRKAAYLLPQAICYCMIPLNFYISNDPPVIQYQGFDIRVTSFSSNITLGAKNSFSREDSIYYFFKNNMHL